MFAFIPFSVLLSSMPKPLNVLRTWNECKGFISHCVLYINVHVEPDGTNVLSLYLMISFHEQPNCIILAISPANQDIATSDAIKLAREVDPTGMLCLLFDELNCGL